MDIYVAITAYKKKCLSKLKRNDAEFFLNTGTIKDLAIMARLIKIKKIEFDNDLKFNIWLSRYLQILMIFSAVSDEPKDNQFIKSFYEVPFECEGIILGQRPYCNIMVSDNVIAKIQNEYLLEEYYNQAAAHNIEVLKKNSNDKMINKVLSYYSTPTLGVIAMQKTDPKRTNYSGELQILLSSIMERHYPRNKVLSSKEVEYVQAMKSVIDFNKT